MLRSAPSQIESLMPQLVEALAATARVDPALVRDRSQP